MAKHSSLLGRSTVGVGRRSVALVLMTVVAAVFLTSCGNAESDDSVATQNVPAEFTNAGFDPPERCVGDCEPYVSVTVDPAQITTETVDYKVTVTYTISNLAKPSDGSGGGFFVTGFDLALLNGGGRGGFVPAESTCPTTEELPVPAGQSVSCSATLRVDGNKEFMDGSYFSGNTFGGTAQILYLDATWNPATTTTPLAQVRTKPGQCVGTNSVYAGC